MGVVDLVVIDCLLRATSKKRWSTFFEKKSAPPDKILAMPMSSVVN